MAQVTSTGGITAPAATGTTVTPAPAPVKTTVTTTTKASTTSAGPGSPPTTFKDDLAKATEKLQPVHHHGRAKILDGPREGQYINESGNKRDGQAFVMEFHGGRRWHVYGTGADRVVIAFARSGAPAAATAKRADGGAEATTGTTAKTATPAATPTAGGAAAPGA